MHIVHLQLLLFLYGPLSLRNCCHKPLLVTELREQRCMMKYGPSGSMPQMRISDARCYYNCTTDGIDMFDDDKQLNEEKIIKYLEELFDTSSTDWKPVLETSLHTCLAKINAWKNHQENSVWSRLWAPQPKRQHHVHQISGEEVSDDLHDCDPSGGVLFACLDSQLVHHCPHSQWDASPNCHNLIESSMRNKNLSQITNDLPDANDA